MYVKKDCFRSRVRQNDADSTRSRTTHSFYSSPLVSKILKPKKHHFRSELYILITGSLPKDLSLCLGGVLAPGLRHSDWKRGTSARWQWHQSAAVANNSIGRQRRWWCTWAACNRGRHFCGCLQLSSDRHTYVKWWKRFFFIKNFNIFNRWRRIERQPPAHGLFVGIGLSL